MINNMGNVTISKNEINKSINIGHETNLLLTQHIKMTFDTFKTRLGSVNVLLLGGTGEGKSRGFIKPIIYSMPVDPRDHTKKMSFVITDPKGELCRDTAGVLKACGYKIRLFNLVDMMHSDCYNPFKYVKNDKDVTILINSLVDTASGGANQKDPHFSEMAKNLLTSLALYIYYELPSEMQNFTTLSKMVPLFMKGEEEEEAPIDNLINIAIKNSPLGDLHPAIVWRRKISARGKELSSIVSVAQGAVKLWADISVQKLTDVDTLSLDTIGDEPTAVYIITPAADSTYDFLVATFYSQMFQTLMYKANMVYHGGLPHHVLIIQDELANTSKINDYDKILSVIRSTNMSVIAVIQAPKQLESVYDNKAQIIIDNTHIQVFLGSGGIGKDSAPTWMSEALGKATVKAESWSINYQQHEIHPNINSSINSGERDLMTASEIRQLSADDCIVMIKGYAPFKDAKIDINTCMNYGSDLFTIKGKNGQRKLKKEFNYVIEDNKKTLDCYFEGKKELKSIDKREADDLKQILVRNSDFASFERFYGTYALNILKVGKIKQNLYINDNFLEEYLTGFKNNKYDISIYLTNETKNKKAENNINPDDINDEENIENVNTNSSNNLLKEDVEVKYKVNVQDADHLIATQVILKENANIKSMEDLANFKENIIKKTGVYISK